MGDTLCAMIRRCLHLRQPLTWLFVNHSQIRPAQKPRGQPLSAQSLSAFEPSLRGGGASRRTRGSATARVSHRISEPRACHPASVGA